MSDYYGINGIDEAKAYLADSVLGPRLIRISEALIRLYNKNAAIFFGSPDDLKLRSCMTLFAAVSEDKSVFQRVLDTFFHGEKDEQTMSIIGK